MEISILVTGGLGFVGSAVVAALHLQHPEWKLSVLDLQEPIEPESHIQHSTCDITDRAAVEELVARVNPTAIIHTAGIVPDLKERYSQDARRRVFDVNVNGTRNVVAAARKNGVKALTAAEAIVLAGSESEQMATCALRPSVVFGPGDRQMIPSLHACIAKGETPFIIGNGLNLWDVTYNSNLADAHVLAVENLLSKKTAAGQAVFISNEQPIPFRHFCLAVWKEFGHNPPFQIRISQRFANMAGLLAEWATWVTGSPSTLSRGSVQDACQTRYCSGVKARQLLGYKPRVGIEEGIRISCVVRFGLERLSILTVNELSGLYPATGEAGPIG
ncbi:MAG: hypothetical protein Q9182_000116 [Xanthomendoza sp. 2 TL-2023]